MNANHNDSCHIRVLLKIQNIVKLFIFMLPFVCLTEEFQKWGALTGLRGQASVISSFLSNLLSWVKLPPPPGHVSYCYHFALV